MRTDREKRRDFVRRLENMMPGEIWRLLSIETDVELCALVEFASPSLQNTIIRRIRSTDD